MKTCSKCGGQRTWAYHSYCRPCNVKFNSDRRAELSANPGMPRRSRAVERSNAPLSVVEAIEASLDADIGYIPQYRLIPLTKGAFAIVDPADYDDVAKFRWILDASGYASRRQLIGNRRVVIRLHRHLLGDGAPEIDHVNRNKLDCRRSNLRPATHSENNYNRPPKANNTSGYKGVWQSKEPGRWTAMIGYKGRRKHLGQYPTPEEAAKAYNAAAKILHGRFAYLNPIPADQATSA